MRVLIAHNRYQQSGGEDHVAAAELELLRSHGHSVERLEVNNDHIQGPLSRIEATVASVYSAPSKRLMRQAIEKHRPEIVHVHNFFPTFSPSIFYACSEAGIPVVHTLHNYRILCAAATLFRDGRVCEECVTGRSVLPGIRHACYRSSRLASAAAGLGMALHAQAGTWSSKVSAYIALTSFAAEKLGSFRIPREKIFIKPNFAADRGIGAADSDYVLFVGRLSAEKGVGTLLEADQSGGLAVDLVILGDGPMREQVRRAAERPGSRLLYRGFQKHEQILEYMRHARALLLPSIWYEGLPLVVVEAFSLGLPVIGADLGNVRSLIRPGETGLLYPAGDPQALSSTLAWYVSHPAEVEYMRGQARRQYLESYTPAKNHQQLIEIYQAAIESREPG